MYNAATIASLQGIFVERYWRRFRELHPDIDEKKARVIFEAYKGLSVLLGGDYAKALATLPDEQIRGMGETACEEQDRRIAAEMDDNNLIDDSSDKGAP